MGNVAAEYLGLEQLFGSSRETEVEEAKALDILTAEQILNALHADTVTSRDYLARLVQLQRSREHYFALVNNLAADAELIRARAGRSIQVIGGLLVATAAEVIRFRSGGANGTAVTGAMSLGANGTLVLPPSAFPYFCSKQDESIYADVTGANAIEGTLTYVLSDADC